MTQDQEINMDFFIDEEIAQDNSSINNTSTPVVEPKTQANNESDQVEPSLESGEIIVKEASKKTPKIKTVDGINWVFPLMTCKHGNMTSTHSCECAINAPEFMSEDCCYTNPTSDNPVPQLCAQYVQKELEKK